jgi:hypothetical protein
MVAWRRTRLPAVWSEQFCRADVRVIVLSDWLPLLVVVSVIWSVLMGGCTSTLTAQIPPTPDALWQLPDLRQYTEEKIRWKDSKGDRLVYTYTKQGDQKEIPVDEYL